MSLLCRRVPECFQTRGHAGPCGGIEHVERALSEASAHVRSLVASLVAAEQLADVVRAFLDADGLCAGDDRTDTNALHVALADYDRAGKP